MESCNTCKRYSYAGLSEASNIPKLLSIFIKLVYFLYNLSVIVIYTSMVYFIKEKLIQYPFYINQMGNIISCSIHNLTNTPLEQIGHQNTSYVIVIIGVMVR